MLGLEICWFPLPEFELLGRLIVPPEPELVGLLIVPFPPELLGLDGVEVAGLLTSPGLLNVGRAVSFEGFVVAGRTVPVGRVPSEGVIVPGELFSIGRAVEAGLLFGRLTVPTVPILPDSTGLRVIAALDALGRFTTVCPLEASLFGADFIVPPYIPGRFAVPPPPAVTPPRGPR